MSGKASSSKRSRDAERLVVLSPHCDDAVFGCAELLIRWPGAVVVTVFAGRPRAGTALTRWDTLAGFREGDDVMGSRRREDRAALARLGSRPCWLEFLDSQYGGPMAASTLIDGLAEAVERHAPGTVAFPLGLFHDDHKSTHEAALAARARRPGTEWLLYADALYRAIDGLVDDRLATLAATGFTVSPVSLPGATHRTLKRSAVACYASQLTALASPGMPGYADVFEPERYWRLRA